MFRMTEQDNSVIFQLIDIKAKFTEFTAEKLEKPPLFFATQNYGYLLRALWPYLSINWIINNYSPQPQ